MRIVVVDDHPVVRKGLARVIEDEADMEVVGECGTAAEARALIDAGRPDLAIVDLGLGAASGLELVQALAASHPGVRVLVLSMRDEQLFAERALRAGASGYIMKDEPLKELLQAIRRVAGGRSYVSERVADRFFSGLTGRRADRMGLSSIDRLSDREREVFELIGHGLGPREIAGRLGVSVRTVDSHQAHLKEKLGLESGRELLRLAVSWTQSL